MTKPATDANIMEKSAGRRIIRPDDDDDNDDNDDNDDDDDDDVSDQTSVDKVASSKKMTPDIFDRVNF